jgi:F-box/WD-40 domain protein MET30
MCEQHIDRKCTKCGWGLPLLEKKRLRTEKRQIQLRATGRGLNEWSPNITPLPQPHAQASGYFSSETGEGPSDAVTTARSKRAAKGAPWEDVSVKRACTKSSKDDAVMEGLFQTRVKRPWKDVYKDRFKVGTN